jgi:(E)-4-hydroxy-3-methylbut-2-enyl-diphosphate synthase
VLSYAADPFVGRRRPTREVRIGDVGVGGPNPIRVQSMTTTDTRDSQATADQVEQLADAGCEIVRITAPSITDAENLREIRAELARRRVTVPLVADIHFTPNAALIAADIVEKVRVNPGNYADKKKFAVREYTDTEYALELERVADRFRPLVRRLAERGAALRIGTNHGSLSDRVLNRYGDTPLGMVESALEFLDVCESEDYRDVVFSMKASNAQVAIQAYRMLAGRLEQRAPGEPSYPLHLGVTEAGDGEDGRIKSAIGIGALLEDGIGDTIRVSLTEQPVRELPVAIALARRAERRWAEDRLQPACRTRAPFCANPYAYTRRTSRELGIESAESAARPDAQAGVHLAGIGEAGGGGGIGGRAPVRVELEHGALAADTDGLAARLATSLALLPELQCEGLRVSSPDAPSLSQASKLATSLAELGLCMPLVVEVPLPLASDAAKASFSAVRFAFPVEPGGDAAQLAEALAQLAPAGPLAELALFGGVDRLPAAVDLALDASELARNPRVLLSVAAPRATHAARIVAARLHERGADLPLLLRFHSDGAAGPAALLAAAIDLGAPLCDGIGDGISLPMQGFADAAAAVDVAYRILQGARLRSTRTEYISCPSCGRTQFDLEETTARIKERTSHLKGVKIAVMGCIVNGPGEMADADFGYVGSGAGIVTLYVGKQIVARGVPEQHAPDRLVELIRTEGSWREPV